MRGKVAKALRKQAYGDKSLRQKRTYVHAGEKAVVKRQEVFNHKTQEPEIKEYTVIVFYVTNTGERLTYLKLKQIYKRRRRNG